MKPLMNDVLLRALLRQPVPYTPVWLMRQAGRFLPEYRALRAKSGSFLAMAHSPDLATEVTLQPVERFNLDAAILFSDILTIPEAMGLGLRFENGVGPVFEKPLQDEKTVRMLQPVDLEKLSYVMDAVSSIRRALSSRVPLLGFSGSPFTLACYMIEGRGSRNWLTVKRMMYARPDLFEHIINVNVDSVAAYLAAQISAGAQAVQIFDTWGGCLSAEMFRRYSLESMRRVIERLPKEHEGRRVPVIVFTKGGGLWVRDLAGIGADAVGLDWCVSLSEVRKAVSDKVALQGNLDPAVLLAGETVVRQEARKVLESYGPVDGGGQVFNLGHGVDIQTPVEAVEALVDEVHSYSRRFH